MQSAQQVSFAHFRLDLANEQLWRGNKPVSLRRQTFAVLCYLVERAGQVVSKAVLLDAAMALSADLGFAQTLSQAASLRGWALAEQGQGAEGIAQMQQGLAAYRETGAELNWPYFLALLAEAHRQAGQTEEGLSAVAEALTVVDNTGERFWEAELYRLKGELTLQQENQKAKIKRQKAKIETDSRSLTPDPHAEAERCFLKATEIAQHQQAKSLELRATMSLARLWQQQGKRADAHLMLAEIYNWFTEGFDTKDLQEAKTLIKELSQ